MTELYLVNENGQMEINFEVLETVVSNKNLIRAVKSFTGYSNQKLIISDENEIGNYTEFIFASKNLTTIICGTTDEVDGRIDMVTLTKDQLKEILEKMEEL